MSAEVRVNEVGDLLYVRLRDGKIARTDTYGDHRLVDVDAHGSVLGAEFIGVDSEIDLRGLPDAARLRDALLSHAPPSFSGADRVGIAFRHHQRTSACALVSDRWRDWQDFLAQPRR